MSKTSLTQPHMKQATQDRASKHPVKRPARHDVPFLMNYDHTYDSLTTLLWKCKLLCWTESQHSVEVKVRSRSWLNLVEDEGDVMYETGCVYFGKVYKYPVLNLQCFCCSQLNTH